MANKFERQKLDKNDYHRQEKGIGIGKKILGAVAGVASVAILVVKSVTGGSSSNKN